jgi:hypothetical protein
MSISIGAARQPYDRAVAHAGVATDSWHAHAVVFAAACVMTGVYWDISWHMTIGRDTFWTPAHLLIQTGGLVAGLSSGFVALRNTFRGTPAQRAASVTFWGFRAPLGAWVSIWGCLAMLTSAPFDDWWHDAYGLDVKIISPPHMVLALGIVSIAIGALLLTLAKQNQTEGRERDRFTLLFALSAGFWLMNIAIMLTEYSDKQVMHTGLFYRMTATFYPFVLLTVARGSKLRWPATTAAGMYMAVMLALMWVIPLFPAEPKLGPIYQPITHMVALDFPVLVIVPAFVLDLIMHRFETRVRDAALAPILGVAFVASFIAVQWPFAEFLITEHSRNWFFNGDNYVYWYSPHAVSRSYLFADWGRWAKPFAPQFALAILLSIFSSYLGLKWGTWMTKVRR